MPTPSCSRRCVHFSGADVIEYAAELPTVVHLCGSGSSSADAALECQARGLASDPVVLTRQYVEELQRWLRQRGFEPISDALKELQTQRRVVELLLAWTAIDREDKDAAKSLLDPRTLQRVQLAKKQLLGRVDDGYVFGRRFLSVSTYVVTLSSEELLVEAEQRSLELPKLDEKQRKAVKALDRELLGLYGTAEGRPLRALTLRQLVTEAEARGMLGPGGEKARDSKGKKSKRAWVDMLRPVMVAEVRAAKIREQEEELLREKLTETLEQEKQREQRRKVVELLETALRGDVGESAEPEDDEATLGEDSQDCDEKPSEKDARGYLQALLKSVRRPTEARAEDVVMKE
jgi:hypothetical protein